MAMLSVANLGLSFGERRILHNVNMTINAGEHVGMVGRNGCGKSTLLKLLAGLDHLKADVGQVQIARDATVGYLQQDPTLNQDHTLREEAATAFAQLNAIQIKIDRVTHDMQDADGDKLEKLLKKYERLEHQLELAGGYAVDHQIDATLHGLGLNDEFFNVKVPDLSGGQKGRLALAMLLLWEPDILLLDEPTNHLDIEGRQWLEDFLSEYRGTVILVSHDRWLLDRVVKRIYELEYGTMFEYPGNYRAFFNLRAQRKAGEQRVYDKQQDNIRQQKGFIDRYKTGQRAKQARGREMRLERFIEQELVEQPAEQATININIKPMARSGDLVISAEGAAKGYVNKPLFSKLNMVLHRGDRIGIIGPNGAGKTTLVRCLIGEQDLDQGTTRVGSQVDIGHYKQTHEHLDLSLTVVDYLRRFVVGSTEQEARGLAGAFLFRDDEQEKPLGTLSGGERSRAVLAGLIVCGHNLLILDEPTNHLDVQSAEQLEQALKTFSGSDKKSPANRNNVGTLILITHDRMLLDDIVNQLLILDGYGNIQHFYGTYSEYIASLKAEATPPPVPLPAPPRASVKQKSSPQPKAAVKKQPGGSLTKLSQQALEDRILKIEETLTQLDKQLANPDIYRDGDKVKKLQQQREDAATKLTPLEDEWARRAE